MQCHTALVAGSFRTFLALQTAHTTGTRKSGRTFKHARENQDTKIFYIKQYCWRKRSQNWRHNNHSIYYANRGTCTFHLQVPLLQFGSTISLSTWILFASSSKETSRLLPPSRIAHRGFLLQVLQSSRQRCYAKSCVHAAFKTTVKKSSVRRNAE